ncbi:MAG: ATP-binding protein [Desulfocapsa sp.]|nr:ATP-binding protein [Desulfocapsa sp.]
MLNQSGKFNDLDTPRIREGRSGREYVPAWKDECSAAHDIVINEVDIDNSIRAKGAIFAGVTTLLEQVGLKVSDLEQIILAGGMFSPQLPGINTTPLSLLGSNNSRQKHRPWKRGIKPG